MSVSVQEERSRRISRADEEEQDDKTIQTQPRPARRSLGNRMLMLRRQGPLWWTPRPDGLLDRHHPKTRAIHDDGSLSDRNSS